MENQNDNPGGYPVPGERVGTAVIPSSAPDSLAVDLRQNLDTFKKNRDVVLEFIRSEYFEEAEYDDKGNPIPGKLGDYYKVAGDPNQKALTKRGASKIKQLFRWHRGAARRVAGDESKEYCSSTVEVPILDQYGRSVGAGIGSCSTAEKRFQSIGSIKKYGGWADWPKGAKQPTVTRAPDYRAALHDVTSIATKRADTQATIVAAALEEAFTGTTEDEGRDEKLEEREPAQFPGQPPVARLPKGKFGKHAGKPVAEVQPTEDLVQIRDWMRGKGKKAAKNPAAWAPLADAIDLELDTRSQEPVDPDDDLPF